MAQCAWIQTGILVSHEIRPKSVTFYSTQTRHPQTQKTNHGKARVYMQEKRRKAPGLPDAISPTLAAFRKMDDIPTDTNGEGWLEWFQMISDAFDLPNYDGLAVTRHIRLLAKFAVTSPQHREAMINYLDNSQFVLLWKTKMNILMGALSESQLADCLYNVAYLELKGKRILSPVFFGQWFIHASVMTELGAPSLSRIAWAIGMLGLNPDEVFKENYVVAFNREFGDFKSYHLADIIWGYGRVGAKMPSDFFELWFQAFERERQHFNANDLAICMWGLAELNVRPDDLILRYWFERIWELFDDLAPNDLCNVMFALGKLEIDPGEEFMDRWYEKIRKSVNNIDVQGFVDSLWGLAKLEIRPTSEFMSLFYEAWRRERLFIMTPELKRSLYAFAKLYIKPRDDFFEHWYESFKRQLSDRNFEAMKEYQIDYLSFDGTTVASFFWAFGRLKIEPTKRFMDKWYPLALKFLPYFTPQDLTNCLWAFGTLGMRPEDVFFKAWLEQFESKKADFRIASLKTILQSFFALKVYPPETFLKSWIRSFAKRIEETTVRDLTTCMCYLAMFQIKPSIRLYEQWSQFVSIWSTRFRLVASTAPGDQLANALWALAKLRIRPSDEFIAEWTNAFQSNLSSFDSSTLAIGLWSMARLNFDMNDEFLDAWKQAWIREKDFSSSDSLSLAKSAWKRIQKHQGALVGAASSKQETSTDLQGP